MGEPILDLAKIPFDPSKASPTKAQQVFRYELAGEAIDVLPISTGNPHSVSFIPDVDALDLNKIGPLAEKHPARVESLAKKWDAWAAENQVTPLPESYPVNYLRRER